MPIEFKKGDLVMYGEIQVTVLYLSLNKVKIKYSLGSKTIKEFVSYHQLKKL